MRVLKIVAEGITTSFRYPHFMQQIHPSFQMPPPATIYGHICSALGEWFDPAGVRFAFHFTHAGEVRDMEHIIVLKPASGRQAARNQVWACSIPRWAGTSCRGCAGWPRSLPG